MGRPSHEHVSIPIDQISKLNVLPASCTVSCSLLESRALLYTFFVAFMSQLLPFRSRRAFTLAS